MEAKPKAARGPNPLGQAPIGGLIRQFAIPSIISLLVSAAYNITDQIFIGNIVGMLGNAATNVAFPVVSLGVALAQLAGVGTSANFNLNLGRKKREEAENYLGTGLVLMLLLGILLGGLVLIFKTPILILCGATETVLPYGQTYLGITALGLPFHLMGTSGTILIRADGSPKYSMACAVSGAGLNVFLDWLFMVVYHWGIQGAAWATVISQLVSFLLCVGYLPRFKGAKITRSMLGLRKSYAINICKLGVANFLNHIVMMTINIVLNNMLTHYGALSIYGSDIPLAVSGVIAKVQTIVVAFTVGLAHGCQPIFSFNMGAKNYGRVRETYHKAIVVAMAMSLVAFALFQLFPRQIAGIFGSGDPLYYEFAEKYFRIYLFMICVTGVQPLSVNYFTSVGNVRQGTFLSVARQGFFLLPLLVILPLIWGMNGILFAGPIAECGSCLLAVTLVRKSFRELRALEQEAARTEAEDV